MPSCATVAQLGEGQWTRNRTGAAWQPENCEAHIGDPCSALSAPAGTSKFVVMQHAASCRPSAPAASSLSVAAAPQWQMTTTKNYPSFLATKCKQWYSERTIDSGTWL